jgi:hypothetical protein
MATRLYNSGAASDAVSVLASDYDALVSCGPRSTASTDLVAARHGSQISLPTKSSSGWRRHKRGSGLAYCQQPCACAYHEP